jgi:sugar lactone lactonase YvrE
VRLRLAGLFVAGLALSLASRGVQAAAVKIWVCDTAAEFSAGEARGVSVTTDGSLLPGKPLSKIDGVSEAVLFCGAPGRAGQLYVGTGDSGRILRVSAEGKVDTFATLSEREVTALRVGPDGALYAGTSPGGKVYRIENGKASLYYDTKAEYIWALAFDGPTLYVGTGLPGEIHRVKAAGAGERVHATPDAHVRALFADAQGRIWAGTSGSGLVLRIDRSGRVATIYDSGKPEVTAIVADRAGRLWAAVGSAEIPSGAGESIPAPSGGPVVKPPKPGAPGDEEPKAEVTVSVSAARLAPPRGSARGGYSSEIVLFEEGETPRVVWSSGDEVVFDLGKDEDGPGVVAATGPKGKLYAVTPDSSSLLRTFDEKQLTFLAGEDVGTNGSSALYRRKAGPDAGEYVSPVKDTARTSRFGAFRFEGEAPAGTQMEFAFRSGDSATPDSTWSPWSAWMAGEKARSIDAPEARFLQWKLKLAADGSHAPVVRRVEAAYRNRNAVPVIESLGALEPAEVLARSASGSSNVFETSSPDEKGIFTSLEDSKVEGSPRKLYRKGYRTLQWKAADPDGDALVYDLEFRPAQSKKWVPLKKDLRETFYSFDSTSLPDGEYVFRVSASDADANPGEAKTATRETSPVRVDNMPPVIRQVSSGPGVFEFEAVDSASPLAEAEYSVDAKKWTRVEPRDGLADSTRESYTIRIPAEARGGYLLVRVSDSSRNVAVASFVAP